jgi:hypothetical protein
MDQKPMLFLPFGIGLPIENGITSAQLRAHGIARPVDE